MSRTAAASARGTPTRTGPEPGSPSPYAQDGRSYHGLQGDRLRRLSPDSTDADAGVALVHASFRALALGVGYTCVAARSVLQRGEYRFGCYPPLGTSEAAAGLAADLWEFVREFPVRTDRFASFVASFDGPVSPTELDFEEVLWQQLQQLHDLDVAHSPWDPTVSPDPGERRFSFSFAGRAFFLVGMHPASSRWSRRTAWPTVVFNAHAQFEQLRESGGMARMQQVNRARDRRVQGSENPSLERFEREPETIMYSGRLVEPDWSCPLRVAAAAVAG